TSERRHWNVNSTLLKTGMTTDVFIVRTSDVFIVFSSASSLFPSCFRKEAARARKRKSDAPQGTACGARARARTSHARRTSSPLASALSRTRSAKLYARAASLSVQRTGAKTSRLSRSFVESDSFSLRRRFKTERLATETQRHGGIKNLKFQI